jgi:hypothetical protein
MLLVKIDDPLENDWLQTIMAVYSGTNNNTGEWRWIGAHDLDDDNVWVWPDGSALTYEHWGGGQPGNNHVGALMQNKAGPFWDTLPADHLAPYICEIY